ncbi:MAG TPA: ABC transporter ATP-binding protein [Tissierellia bacterium]|nr:ABC transporter ATP-binding protein [Tissierellia bacterium]
MKELLLERKGKFILYILACMLPIIDSLLMNMSFVLILGSIERGDINYFIKVMIMAICFSVLGSLLFITSRFMRISFMRDTILDVRLRAFDRIINYSYKEFNKRSKDVYISNLINDINIFEQNFFLKLINVIYSGGYYIVSLIILAFIDFKFTIGIFTVSVLVFFISKAFQNKTVKLQEDVSESNEKFTTNVSNTFNGLEILKLNRVEDKFLYNTLKSIDKVERKKLHYTVFTEGQSGFINYFGFLIMMGILVYAINSFMQGVSFTKILFLVQLSNGCIWPIVRIIPLFNELKASAKIYEKITGNGEETTTDNNRSKDFVFNSTIEVKDLKFDYDGKEIFKGATFTIEKGKKYLIKGPSGAGKSTLIKLLSMAIEDYEGTIMVDGVDYRNIKEESMNNNISFVYQDVFLFEDTIYNNITLFKEIPESKVLKACEGAGLMELIEEKENGLNEMLLENGKNLSGGQRQRISIARALVRDVDLLFIDEATSNLNEELGRLIENTILSLDATVVAISHRYYEGITEKYDYVLEIKDGLVNKYTSQDYFEREVLAI